jgi:hypothetical protein
VVRGGRTKAVAAVSAAKAERSAKLAEHARRKAERQQRARDAVAEITWLPVPRRLMVGSRARVVGVAADAAPEVRRQWLGEEAA